MTSIEKESIRKLAASGLSHAKIAEQLGIPKGTVKSFLYRTKDDSACANCGSTLIPTPHKRHLRTFKKRDIIEEWTKIWRKSLK